MQDTNTPIVTPRKTKKTLVIVLGCIVGSVLIIGVATVLVRAVTGQNWALGVGPQQSDSKLDTVKNAVMANSAVVDVYVKNANTSGTPFGHSIDVVVVFDETLVDPQDKRAVGDFADDIQAAIVGARVADAYTLFVTANDASSRVEASDRAARTNALLMQEFEVK